MLSGIIDIALGVVSFFTGVLAVKDFSLPTYAICFMVGFIYLAAGILVAMLGLRKRDRLAGVAACHDEKNG